MSERVEVDAVRIGQALIDVYNANTHIESPSVTHEEFCRSLGSRALELCAARVPAEVWGVLEEMRKCDSDGVELYAVTAYANKLEAALKSTGQEAPKPEEHPAYRAALCEVLERLGADGNAYAAYAHKDLPVEGVLRAINDHVSWQVQRERDGALEELSKRPAAPAPRALPMGDGEIADALAKSYTHYTGREPGPAERTAFLGMARDVFDMVREYSVGAADELQKLRGQMATPRALPTQDVPNDPLAAELMGRWLAYPGHEEGVWSMLADAARDWLREHVFPPPARALPTINVKRLARIISGLSEDKWSRLQDDTASFWDEAAKRAAAELREHASPADEAAKGTEDYAYGLAVRALNDKLTQAERERDEALTRVAELQTAVTVLRGERDEARRFVENERALSARFVGQLEELKGKLAEAERERDSLADECKTAQSQRTQAERERDEARNELENCKLRNQQLRKAEATLLCLEKDYCIEGDYAPDGPGDTRHPVTRRVEAMHTADVKRLESVINENKRKADDHRRQRDEAREELAELQSVVDGLHAQLAARPEPVVIDEALACKVRDSVVYSADIVAALRSVLGEKVSVAGLAKGEAGYGYELACRSLNDKLTAAERSREQLRAELQAAQADRAKAETHRDELALQLQAAQAELGRFQLAHDALGSQLLDVQRECTMARNNEKLAVATTEAVNGAHRKACLALERLSPSSRAERMNHEMDLASRIKRFGEQCEALRAECDRLVDKWAAQGDYHRAKTAEGATYEECADALSALLKPATTEAQNEPETCLNPGCDVCHGGTQECSMAHRAPVDARDEEWVNASRADALRPNDRHAQYRTDHVYPTSPGELAARMDRVEAALRTFLAEAARGWTHTGAARALAMLDAGKQEAGNGNG